MIRPFTIGMTVFVLVGGLAACNSPGERAVGGALIGGGSGALIGGALGGRRGALVGAGVGGVGGAIVGAGTTPRPAYGGPVYVESAPVYRRPRGCPYGAYEDEYGNVFCR